MLHTHNDRYILDMHILHFTAHRGGGDALRRPTYRFGIKPQRPEFGRVIRVPPVHAYEIGAKVAQSPANIIPINNLDI